jgi:hypothetical protein
MTIPLAQPDDGLRGLEHACTHGRAGVQAMLNVHPLLKLHPWLNMAVMIL